MCQRRIRWIYFPALTAEVSLLSLRKPRPVATIVEQILTSHFNILFLNWRAICDHGRLMHEQASLQGSVTCLYEWQKAGCIFVYIFH